MPSCDPLYFAEALGVLRRVAQERATLTAHDVRQKLGITPKTASILGTVMLHGIKAGWIRPSGDWQESRYAMHHARPVRVFASLLYGNPPGVATITQPQPVESDAPAITDLLVADLLDRDAIGVERYGTRLKPDNGRDALVDAYQEQLDGLKYARQALWEKGERNRVIFEISWALAALTRRTLYERDGK